MSVCWSVGWSFINNFTRWLEVTLLLFLRIPGLDFCRLDVDEEDDDEKDSRAVLTSSSSNRLSTSSVTSYRVFVIKCQIGSYVIVDRAKNMG